MSREMALHGPGQTYMEAMQDPKLFEAFNICEDRGRTFAFTGDESRPGPKYADPHGQGHG